MPTPESTIQIVESVCASISLISCAIMGYKIWKDGVSNTANRMLSFLFIVDFILAIAYVIGRSAIPYHGLCQFQALLIQWFSVVAILWAVLMAYQMRQWIVAKKHPKRIESAMRSYILVIIVASFILAIILLGVGVYGDAYLWCWITPDHAEIRLLCFDTILFASWGLIAYFLWEVSVSISLRLKRSSLNARVLELLAGQTSMQKRLMLYVAIFVAVWFFAILNRLLEWGTGESIFATAVIQALMLSLQGLWNALAFTDALGLLSIIGLGKGTDNFILNKEIKPTSELREVLLDPPKIDLTAKRHNSLMNAGAVVRKYTPKQYSLFITTLNMGEASLASMMPDLPLWIVKGHDVYAIGVQECLDLQGVSEAIHAHLGGPNVYSMYKTAIGSGNTTLGYHGYIALMLYVRVADIKSGAIVPTQPAASTMATGADLIVTTAQNKGAVGLPLQIHDTNISFVTCHLPSDSKGTSKLTKRNASAHAILRGLTLAPEDVGFDLHLQHDHVLVFGDMNYRMDSAASGGGMGSLSGVAVACLIEKSAMADDTNWHNRRYNLMRVPTDPMFPTVDEIRILKAARAASRGAWSSVLRADELRAIMADGDAFCGFEEPMPCFPPSYKRKKGDVEGNCGDYTDPLQIIQGYTNTGEVQELDVSRLSEAEIVQEKQKIAAKKLRPPSYTDRVLIHSLPDRQDRLTVQSYDFCDNLRISDHRAVSMAVRLEVNTSVSFQNHAPVTTGAGADAAPDPAKEPNFQLYELTITGLSVALDPGFSTTGKPGEEEDSDDSEDEGRESDGSRLSKSQDEGDEGDDGPQNRFVEFNKAEGKTSSKRNSTIAVTDNPLLSNPAADAALKRAGRTRSGRGVKFAEDDTPDSSSGKGGDESGVVSIEMSPTGSPSNSPNTSPPPSRPTSVNGPLPAAPAAAPAASPAPSPAAPAASAAPPRPSPARPGMLVRAKSANAAVLNATPSTTTATTDTGDSSATAAGDAGAPASPARKPRFLARLSMAITGTNASALTEAAQAADRQRTDAVMSRSLVKNRNRSIFGAFRKSVKVEAPVDETGDIINELSRDSLAWEGDTNTPGQWRKRLQQEQDERRAAGKKKGSAKIVSKIKKNKKLKKNDKKIAQVVVVFPLPVKDPLLSHRKLYDFAHAYNITGDGDLESNMMQMDESQRNITREELLRPLSRFQWVEDASAKGSSKKSKERASEARRSEGNSPTSSAESGSGKMLGSKAANTFRVTGCASPELGAHVLLKFLNPSGYELGSAVVPLTHLLHTSTEEVHATQFTSITIASGGQQRGTISGKFSLKYLPSLVSSK